MDDEDDIFARIDSFTIDKNLDKALGNILINNDSLDDVSDFMEVFPEKLNVPKHSTKCTKKLNNLSNSNNESIIDESVSNKVKGTRQKKKKKDDANDNHTVNNNIDNTKSADKANDTGNTNLNNTRRTRQSKRQSNDISNTKSTDEVAESSNSNASSSNTSVTRQRKGRRNNATDSVLTVPPSSTLTSSNNTNTTRQGRKGRRNNATDSVLTAPPSSSTLIGSNNTSMPRQGRRGRQNNITTTPSLSSTSTATLNETLSDSIRTLMDHIVTFGNTRRRCRSNRRRTRSNRPSPIAINQNTRARRNFVAEIAARAPVIDSIDLISSPIVQFQTTEPIDLEEDNVNEKESNVNNSTDCNEETDNITLKIKVKWGRNIEVFPCRKYQKFTDIIKHFAELENVPKENICLNLDEKIISENDTPDSINYKTHMFIYGRKVKDSIISIVDQGMKDPNSIEIKIQCKELKKPIIMSIKKSNTFAVLYEKCSEELKIPTSNIVLKFDGEILNAKDKPEDFDLEGNEIIDCHIKK